MANLRRDSTMNRSASTPNADASRAEGKLQRSVTLTASGRERSGTIVFSPKSMNLIRQLSRGPTTEEDFAPTSPKSGKKFNWNRFEVIVKDYVDIRFGSSSKMMS